MSSSYEDYKEPFAGLNKAPAYGFEAWCNMEGRFTFFVASEIPEGEMTVCSIAVMGTRYLRYLSIVESFEIETGA